MAKEAATKLAELTGGADLANRELWNLLEQPSFLKFLSTESFSVRGWVSREALFITATVILALMFWSQFLSCSFDPTCRRIEIGLGSGVHLTTFASCGAKACMLKMPNVRQKSN